MFKAPDFQVMFLPNGNRRARGPLAKPTLGNPASPRRLLAHSGPREHLIPASPKEKFLGIARRRKPLSHCPTQGNFSHALGKIPCPESSAVGMLALPGAAPVPAAGGECRLARVPPPCDRCSPQTSLPALRNATSPLLPEALPLLARRVRRWRCYSWLFLLLDLGLQVNCCCHPGRQRAKRWREGRGQWGQPCWHCRAGSLPRWLTLPQQKDAFILDWCRLPLESHNIGIGDTIYHHKTRDGYY